MISHRAIRPAPSALAILLSLVGAISSSASAADAEPQTPQDFLRHLAPLAPDECSPPYSRDSKIDVDNLEERLFESVGAVVADRLNKPPAAQTADAESRVRSALLEVERSSLEINRSWPSEDRFHFEIWALHPAILVRMSYRSHAKLLLLGRYDLGKYDAVAPDIKWGPVYVGDPDSTVRDSAIDLFPLHRGPSGRLRFLTRVWRSGCAGSIGEEYYGWEWTAANGQSPEEVIKIEGAEGLGEESKHVGKLSTTGKTIQLPYCYFSAVDTWDNPTLCAADSFDLSRDVPRFIGRIYNFPDLVLVNNAIQHARARDYAALRGYCASDAVARKLVREIPPYLFPDEVKTVKVSPTRETVFFEEGPVQFNLVKRGGEWLLESFRIGDGR